MKSALTLAVLALSCAGYAAAAAPNTPAAPPAALTGEVLEVRDVDMYTYLRLKTKDGETWAAVTKAPLKKGAQVTIANPVVMTNFESKSLKKTFDKIVFGSIVDPKAPAAMGASMLPHGSAGGTMGGTMASAPKAGVPVAKVAKASGADARTVAEVVADKATLKDKRVSVRGQVVKANIGIMGKNWFHVQDGSGNAAAGTNDLLVTSKDKAAVGDIVTIKGTVHTNVKLGAGYDYAVLVEDATIGK